MCINACPKSKNDEKGAALLRKTDIKGQNARWSSLIYYCFKMNWIVRARVRLTPLEGLWTQVESQGNAQRENILIYYDWFSSPEMHFCVQNAATFGTQLSTAVAAAISWFFFFSSANIIFNSLFFNATHLVVANAKVYVLVIRVASDGEAPRVEFFFR